MRKLLRERSVCAPHNAFEAISSGPNASLSVRVDFFLDLRRDLAIVS
jgi:hypothetical protein